MAILFDGIWCGLNNCLTQTFFALPELSLITLHWFITTFASVVHMKVSLFLDKRVI